MNKKARSRGKKCLDQKLDNPDNHPFLADADRRDHSCDLPKEPTLF